MWFLWLKNKIRSKVKAGISYTSEHCCLLQLTLIPALSCLPLPLRKFNLLPCHCYNNLQLLDTSLSMTVSQNPCHTHLRQAVFGWYIFILHSCRADFQSLFPSVAAQGQAAQGRGDGCATPSSFGFSRANFFFFFFQSKNLCLWWWLQPPSVFWPWPCVKHSIFFRYVPTAPFPLSKKFQCLFFSNSAKFLRAFCSQFQILHSFTSFYLLILICPSKLAFHSPFFLTKWFSCIFQYHFPRMAYHSWIIHKALVSSHPSSAFIMKVCSISGSEKGQLG